MRTSILAIIVAFGTTIVVPALAQQQPTPGQQEEADKGIKTRNSGESGYVSEQEKPGASSHAPGQPDTNSNQTTTGGSGTRRACWFHHHRPLSPLPATESIGSRLI